MKQLKRLFSPILLLILIESALLATNYQLGTYLVGWDNLMPELNLGLNFNRSLVSLWQEYRGLGLLDGLAHSANFLHTFYIWLLSLILPQNLLRYTYIHLTHLIGGIAFYYLIKYLLQKFEAPASPAKRGERNPKHDTIPNNQNPKLQNKSLFGHSNFGIVSIFDIRYSNLTTVSAFLGALFYMFNIGIIQMYFAPLEVFATHFAALPLLTLVILKALHKPTRKNFSLLFFAALLVSPQGFVPTVFIAFLILFFFLLLFHTLQTKQWKVALLTGLTVFFANAFWLVPYMVSATSTPSTIQNTRINQFGSEEIYYRNKAHGTLTDTLGLNGFMLSTIEFDQTKSADVFFMEEWRNYQKTTAYTLAYLISLTVIGVGVLQAVRKRYRILYPFLAAAGVAFIFLANNTPILEQLNTLFRLAFPVLGEAFRFPFTKFITLFAFCLSIFLSFGITVFFARLKHFSVPGIVIGLVLIGVLAFPAFQGNFTSPLLRLTIPEDYFRLMNYFRTVDPNQRIAVLPTHTFWNWHYRTWGHRGSGFLWYGIQQPMLERAFDPWSLKNEQYYNELQQALATQDQNLFHSVLQKYDISYLFVDQYVINTLSSQPINYNSLVTFLDKSPSLQNKKTFGRLLVYQTIFHPSFVYATSQKTANINQLPFMREDHAHLRVGNYVTDTVTEKDRIYPLANLFTEKLQGDLVFTTKIEKEEIIITPQEQNFSLSRSHVLQVPNLFASEYLIPVEVKPRVDGLELRPLYPDVLVNNQRLRVTVTPLLVSLTSVRNPTQVTFTDTNHALSLTGSGAHKTFLLRDYPNNLRVSDGKTSETVSLDTSVMSKAPITLSLPTTSITSLSFAVPIFPSPFTYTDILKNREYQLQRNEEHMHPFSGPQSKASGIQLGGIVTLTARSANEELVFYKRNLFHQASYLMHVKAEYHSGLPLSFYIDNPYEHRAEFETVLSKKLNDTIFIIPRTQNVFSGYGFHLIAKSVGTEEAESVIKNIAIYPFPQTLIEETNFTSHPLSDEKPKYTRTKVRYHQYSPALYVTENIPAGSYLNLSQAYDAGWQAFSFASQPSLVQQYLPFLGGKRLTPHLMSNNWSNAWKTSTGANYVVIFYLPIYLQHLGQLLTLVSIIGGIIFVSIYSRKSLS